MSLTLAIALNVILDIGLLGGLAWSMSHARKLTPHVPAAANVEVIELRGALVEIERHAA
jgi:hypothetical protein